MYSLATKLSVPIEDIKLGILNYAIGIRDINSSRSSKIKRGRNDFIVKEIIDLPKQVQEADWLLILIKKPYGVDSMAVLRLLANKLPLKDIYIYGLKDKYSEAYQYICLHRRYIDIFNKIIMDKGIEIVEIKHVSTPHIVREYIAGNEFKIAVYNPPRSDVSNYICGILEVMGVPNYYGYQRFGVHRLNHIAGKTIILGKNHLDSLPEHLYKILVKVFNFNKYFSDKRWRKRNKRLINLLLNSFQSYMFNLAISLRMQLVGDLHNLLPGDYYFHYEPKLGRYIIRKCDESITYVKNYVLAVPLLDYKYLSIDSNDSFRDIYMELLEREGLSIKDFKRMAKEKLLVTGGFRKAILKPKQVSYEYIDGKMFISFVLDRGGYATIVLRELIKPLSPSKQGF